jgi:hypothetical protein
MKPESPSISTLAPMTPSRPSRRALLAILLGAALPLACGDDSHPGPYKDLFAWSEGSSACGPTSCSGCCQSGSCVAGTSTSACGTGGYSCDQCSSSQTCSSSGVCTAAACDSTSCASGCCDSSGACQGGTSTSACGTGGATCAACTSTQACSSGACTTKTSSMYKVTLVSCTFDSNCGLGDTCDAFVVLTVGKVVVTSSTKDDANSPSWSEYMLTATESELSKQFDVVVKDEDTISDDTMGTCSLAITSSVISAGKIVSDCGDAKNLTFTFAGI